MVRIDVPDDVPAGYQLTVAGYDDLHHGAAEVNLDDVATARNVRVREDDRGRYVRTGLDRAAAIADAVGGTVADGDDTGTCRVVKSDGEVCGRDRPCRYHD